MGQPLYREELKRRARRSLVCCAVLLCVSSIPGGWLVDHCPLHIRFPLAASMISAWARTTPPPGILFLGSSRMGSFVRTDELASMTQELCGKDPTPIFNATLTGGEPITMEFLANKLLASEHPGPRLVVMETSSDLLPRDNLYFKLIISRQLTAVDLRKYFSDIVLCHDAIPRLVSSRLTPFYLHRGQFLRWTQEVVRRHLPAPRMNTERKPIDVLNPERPGDSEKGLPPPDERLRLALRRFQTHLRHYQLAGATSEAFERTVAMLHSRGCAILLVQTPLSSEQRALFSSDMLEQFQAFVERLQRNYGCQFVDYSDRLPDSLFSDNHHGTPEGSATFTRLLAQEVVAPAWLSLKPPAEK